MAGTLLSIWKGVGSGILQAELKKMGESIRNENFLLYFFVVGKVMKLKIKLKKKRGKVKTLSLIHI